MGDLSRPSISRPPRDRAGCCYIIEDNDPRRSCGALRRPGSPYCLVHHALCYIAGGTTTEAKRLREVEALATAVGGRRGDNANGPSQRFLRKLEQAVRPFS